MKNAVLYFLLLFIFSCYGKSNYEGEKIQNIVEKRAKYSAAKNNVEIFSGPNENKDKKIIKSGKIEYSVNELSGIEDAVFDKVKLYKGDIFSSSLSTNLLIIVVKIPSEKFDDFIKNLGTFGKVINKYINSTDVTKEFFDLEERIKNKKLHLDKIRKYLKEAKNIDEILKVESEINRITNELESLEGSFNSLSDKTSYSTLEMEFRLPYKFKGRTFISFLEKIKDLFYNVANFFIMFFVVLIYFIIILVPLLLLAGLIYYVGFGKFGIIKKYFNALSSERKKNRLNEYLTFIKFLFY